MNYVLLALLAAALVWIECWIGGTRLAFSLAPYTLLAVAALLTIPLLRRPAPRADRLSLLSSLLLFGYVLVRAACSPVDYLWWTDFYMVVACLMAYLLMATQLSGARERTWLLVALFVVAVAETLVGFRQFSEGSDFMPFGLLRPPSGRRASGFFISPISLAGYLETLSIIGVSFACWSRWPSWVRGIVAILTALCTVGVALTGSRGGYLSLTVSLVVFACLSWWIVRRLFPERLSAVTVGGAAGLLLFLAAAALGMGQSELLRSRLHLLGDQFGSGHWDARIYNWQAAWKQFRLAPLWGTGAGTHLIYGRLFRLAPLQADPIHAHSDYLEMLAEYGLVGLAGMSFFLFAHVRSGARALLATVERRFQDRYAPRSNTIALVVGSLCAVAGYLAHSAIDFNLHIPGNALVFAVLFGILATPDGDHGARNPPGREWPAFAAWLALPLLGLLMLATGLPKLQGETLAEKARIALREGDFEKAAALGEEALQAEPRNPEIYFTIGEARRGAASRLRVRSLRRPLLEAAASAYRAGLRRFPHDENLWVRLGQALDGLSRYAEAEDAYREALACDPNLGILHAYHAAHLRSCGRTAEAEEELQRGEALAGISLAAAATPLPP